jgi:transaldolase
MEAGEPLDRQSVASFFVSRVDTEVDKRLGELGRDDLRGVAAIANARAAYQRFKDMFYGDRYAALRAAGAPVQRPLWASTGVKDPRYDDTMYVVELVAPNTVNTVPEATLNAVADHGHIRGNTISGTYAESQKVIDDLAALGIQYNDVIELLETEGVQKFEDSYAQLVESVKAKIGAAGAR